MAKRRKKHSKKSHHDLDTQLIELAVAKNKVLLDAIAKLGRDAVGLQEELADCVYFQFLDLEHIARMAAGGHDQATGMFWRTLNSLLVYCTKTESAAVVKIKDALVCSIALENEIALALAGRAVIEHAAATYAVVRRIEGRRNDLSDNTWPFSRISTGSSIPTEQDHEVFKEIFRFAVGRRIQQTTPLPLPSASKGEWERFNKLLEDVPAELKTANVLTEIGKLGKDHLPVLYAVYGFLSEYCHPNSSSRAFEFLPRKAPSSRSAVFAGPSSVGFHHIMELLKIVLPDICEILSRALHALNNARPPMDPLDLRQKTEPFSGSMMVVDPFGRIFWMAPHDLSVREAKGIKLNSDQEQRAAAIYTTFREFLGGKSLSEWFSVFEKEGNIDRELSIWEHLAFVYNNEMKTRGQPSEGERFLVYNAIHRALYARSLGEVLKLDARLAKLADVERVFKAVARGPQSADE